VCCVELALEEFAMKIRLTTATLALVSVPVFGPGFSGFAQSARMGVSTPEAVVIAAEPEETATVKVRPAKPSAAVPMTSMPAPVAGPAPTAAGAGSGEMYGAYVPYRGASRLSGEEMAGRVADPDGAIVTSVEDRPGEVREGTLLRVRTKQTLSTETTQPGSRFTAELAEPVMKDGRVVVPVGAVLEGRVTEVHGGRRISGAAMMHLEPRSVALPDGTHYMIRAQLIDTDQASHSKIDGEGTLVRRDHPKEALAAVGLATGGAAAAGGMIGGGVGAVVGAGIGAGAGAIVWLKQDRQAVLPQDSMLVFSLTEPMPLMPVGATPVSRMDRSGAAARKVLPSGAGEIVE